MNGKFLLLGALVFVGCGGSESAGDHRFFADDYEGWSAESGPDSTGSALKSSLRVFVTSTMYAPTFGDIYGADEICAHHASTAGLGGRWKAWISSSKMAAPTRMRGDGPWTFVDGKTVVFPEQEARFVAPLHAIDHDELGREVSKRSVVWTGTSHLGEPGTACNDWSPAKPEATGEVGVIGGSDTAWTAASSVPCVGGAYLYCFEQP